MIQHELLTVTFQPHQFVVATRTLVRAVKRWKPRVIIEPVAQVPGADVMVIPPGVRYIRQYDVVTDRVLNRIDVHVAK